MGIRTNHKMVEDVLQQCWDSSTKLDRYMRIASLVVDQVATCATEKGHAQDAAVLKEMETWLAAHYYTKMDPVYTSRSTDGASGSFVRNKDTPEPFLDAAMNLDFTGCLNAIINKKRASVGWMGRPPSEQTPYTERD